MSTFTPYALRWLEVLLEERFGHTFSLAQQGDVLQLTLAECEGVIRFDQLQSVFHQSSSDFPCYHWRASSEGYSAPIGDIIPAPSMHELPDLLVELDGLDASIHYDLLGLAYWMLTRLEEVGRADLDSHQRFPALSSHAYRHGYLERPIVDEWLSILGQVVLRVWPQIQLKEHKFSMRVSHDVDSPSLYGFTPWRTVARMMMGHLLKRRDLRAFFTVPYVKLGTRVRLHPADPYNTFDWLMDLSEANNLTSAFYFICGRTDPSKDAHYTPDHPAIRDLMRKIHERGHEIGLHPSYNTFQQPELIRREAECLKRVCAEEGIDQPRWGGRMHYLRWQQPVTMRAWAEAGMDYDSTLGYADRPGFRCGTCYEYPAFDPVAQVQLTVRIRPLVMMECTVIDDVYLGLGISEAAEENMKVLKKHCRMVQGQFVLLWHNSYFISDACKSIYQNLLRK